MNPSPTTPPRPLGRTPPTRVQFARLVRQLPRVPHLFRGVVPDRSPNCCKYVHRIPWYQHRGFCVGWTGAKTVGAVARIPFALDPATGAVIPADPTAEPRDVPPFSPLFAYDTSRMEARDEGIDMGNDPGENGDGSIVSCFLKAAGKVGCCPWSADPSDPRYEDGHRNGTVPPATALESAKQHICKTGLYDSFDAMLQGIAGGLFADVGTTIGEGFQSVDPAGYIHPSRGAVLGGHSYGIADYCVSQNWMLIYNNWERWGIPCASPIWAQVFGFAFSPAESAAMGGFSNMAFAPLDEMRAIFTARRMASGDSEAGVVNAVAGEGAPTPLLIDYSTL